MSTTTTTRRAFLTRSAAALAGVTLGPTLLAACGSDDDSSTSAGGGGGAGQTLRPKLIDVPPGSSGAIYRPVMDAQGLLAPLNLEPSFVGAQPSETQTSLLSGAVDIGTFGPIGAAQANAGGEAIRLIGPILNNHVRWIVHGDSDFKSIEDLRGERIGTQQETTATYQTTMMTAELAGIDFKNDYQISTGAPPALLALFERGDIAALAITEPTATLLVADGARDIAGVSELWEEYSGVSGRFPLAFLAAKQSWIDEDPEMFEVVTTLYRQVNEYLGEDPAHIVEFAEAIGVPPDNEKAMEMIPDRMGYIWDSAWDDEVFDSLKRQLEVAVDVGILDALPDEQLYIPDPS